MPIPYHSFQRWIEDILMGLVGYHEKMFLSGSYFPVGKEGFI